jgi:hypothetical protein
MDIALLPLGTGMLLIGLGMYLELLLLGLIGASVFCLGLYCLAAPFAACKPRWLVEAERSGGAVQPSSRRIDQWVEVSGGLLATALVAIVLLATWPSRAIGPLVLGLGVGLYQLGSRLRSRRKSGR